MKVLTFVEIDVPRCTLNFSEGACRARLGYADDPTSFVAATFAGSTTLERGAGLSGAADAKTFTVNAWFRRASAASDAVLLAGVTAVGGATWRLVVYLEATTNKLIIKAKNAAGTEILNVSSSAVSLDGMHHVVASFDLSDTAKRHLYIDGASDLATVTTYTDDSIDLTVGDWSAAGYADGTSPLTGDLGDLWLADGVYIDLSVSANLREWIGAHGHPIDLGADGSTPTGTAPLVYLGRDITTFHTNLGSGGGFTLAGDAPTETVPAVALKCFNSLGTCSDRTNFADDPVTLRFAKPTADLPHDDIEVVEACIESVEYSPAIISLGEDLGQRASIKVTLRDFPHPDNGDGFDKYPTHRDYDAYRQGTFWGRFRARNPFLRGRALRFIRGYLGQALADMETHHFVIESFDGPGLDGRFTVVAKDVLKLADGDRAQAPLLNTGRLNAGITAGAASATLTPSGIGDEEYAASGYLNIGGKETVAFTRSGDTLTLTRGQFNTTGVAHEAGDRCQQCLYYPAWDPADISNDLLTTFAGVAASYITLADWQAETAAYYRRVLTALIPEPTPVKKLLTELVQQVGMAIWSDDLNQKIRLQVLRSIETGAETYDDSNIDTGSLTVREQPQKRVSRVQTFFGLKTPFEPLDEPSSYRSSALTPDTTAELNDGKAIKRIYSRWIPFGGLTAAERVNEIQLGRFVTAPRHISLRLSRASSETPTMGKGVRVQTKAMQDETGANANVPGQITRLRPGEALWDVEIEEMLFEDLNTEDLNTHTITIDAETFNENLRAHHDLLYASITAGDSVVCNILSGVVVGSTSTSTRAMEIGNWSSVAATGDRTSGSAVISALSINTTTEGLTAGMFVRGTGITNGTKILTVDSPTQVTLDANATSSGTGGALTFYTNIITVNVRGRIQGKGGKGGRTPSDEGIPYDGLIGGDALFTQYPINLVLDAGDAEIWGGGGGGAGSGSYTGGGGGGGGAGTNGGAGGLGVIGNSVSGSAGTSEAGGAGGNGVGPYNGGAGGGPGLAGASAFAGGSGGSAGDAIDGVSYCKKTGTGDIRGSQIN